MKFSRHYLVFLKNQKGVSLVQVMIAAGIMGVLMVAFMRFQEQQFKASQTTLRTGEIANIKNTLIKLLGTQKVCTNLFETNDVSLLNNNVDQPSNKIVINQVGGENFNINTDTKYSGLKVVSMWVQCGSHKGRDSDGVSNSLKPLRNCLEDGIWNLSLHAVIDMEGEAGVQLTGEADGVMTCQDSQSENAKRRATTGPRCRKISIPLAVVTGVCDYLINPNICDGTHNVDEGSHSYIINNPKKLYYNSEDGEDIYGGQPTTQRPSDYEVKDCYFGN